MTEYKVSIIISVYNAELYLEKCLNSIVNQSLKDIELIIVNNGSNDSSREIINNFNKRYDFISVVNIKKNTGDPSIPWNIGVGKSRGEYIGFVDSDDWCALTLFEELYKFARKRRYKIVLCDCIEVLPDGKENIWYQATFSYHDILIRPHLPVWAKLYHRSIFKDYSLSFQQHIHCDAGFNMVAYSFVNDIGYLCKPLYYYNRSNPKSETNTKKRFRQAEVINTFKWVLNNCNKRYYEEILFAVFCNAYSFLVERYIFFADFYIEFLHEYSKDILKNRYFKTNTNNYKFILDLLNKELIPNNVIVNKNDYMGNCEKYISDYKFIYTDNLFHNDTIVKKAIEFEDFSFVKTYKMLLGLYQFGGIMICNNVEIMAPLGNLRLYKCCFIKKDFNTIDGNIIIAQRKSPIIKKIIDNYKEYRGKNLKKSYKYDSEVISYVITSILKCTNYNEECIILAADVGYYGIGDMARFRINKSNINTEFEFDRLYIERLISRLYELEEENKIFYIDSCKYKKIKSLKTVKIAIVIYSYIRRIFKYKYTIKKKH